MKGIKDIYQLFVALIGLHYFYSFIILNRLLGTNGLDSLPIISMEDLTFPFGIINYSIISFSLFGFIWIYGWRLMVDDEDKVLKSAKDSVSGFHKYLLDVLGGKLFEKLSKEKVEVVFYLMLLLVLAATAYCIVVLWLMKRPDGTLGGMFIFNFLIIPAFYIFYKSKRNIIFIGYIGFTIIWGLFFIKTSCNNIAGSNKSPVSKISFEYHEKMIISNLKHSLIYPGYKYLIMRNDSTKSNELYPMSDVKKIIYTKIK